MASSEFVVRPVARIRSDFASKFGIPKQSGLVPALTAKVVFEPEYRSADALRGIEGYSHLWLLWQFSASVRPGLSCVELERVDPDDPEGPVLIVRGADLMDGTPILDVKPYIPYADSRPGATGGFTDSVAARTVRCVFPPELLERVPPDKREALIGVLEQDPRPSYQDDPDRVYGFGFAGREIRFRVSGGVLTVIEVL